MNPCAITLSIFGVCVLIFHVCIYFYDYYENKTCRDGARKQWLHARNELWAWDYEHPYATENDPDLQKLIQIEAGAYMRYVEWWPEKANKGYLEALLSRIPSQQKNS